MRCLRDWLHTRKPLKPLAAMHVQALADFKNRIAKYEKVYEEVRPEPCQGAFKCLQGAMQ